MTDNCALSLTDRAGNVSEITISLEHTCIFTDGICSICGKSEYEDYILTEDNYTMAGITREGNIVIPEIFEYDNIKYKTVGIGNGAFYNCNSLTSISIPNSVKFIGYMAFYNCTALTRIEIPEGVEIIEDMVFRECTNLEYISIPHSIISLSENAIDSCPKLTHIYYNSEFNIDFMNFQNRSNLTVTVGKDITSEKLSNNFCYCAHLIIEEGGHITTIPHLSTANFKTIVIPLSVKRIEDEAFKYSSLTSLHIPSSVSYIGKNIISGTRNLTEITFDGSAEISDRAFSNAQNLKKVSISGNVSKMGSYVFYDCPSLNTVNISSNANTFVIGESSFSSNEKLTNITLPSNIESIPDYSFYNCTSLSSIIIGNETENYLMNKIRSIGMSAFGQCTSLPSIFISENITSIMYMAFENVPHIEYHGTATGAPWGALSMN